MTAFDADNPSNDSKRYIAYNAITNMMYYAKELTQNYNDYENTDRNSRNSIVLFSAIRDNLNNYVQTFMDCVIVLCDCPSTTLRGLVTSFLSTYKLSNDLECWVQFFVFHSQFSPLFFRFARHLCPSIPHRCTAGQRKSLQGVYNQQIYCNPSKNMIF